MPIRFRCPHCERLLGIAKRKAGAQIHCPQCGAGIAVPHEDDEGEPLLRDLDDLLGAAGANGEPALPAPEPARPAVATEPRPVPVAPRPAMAPSRPAPKRRTPGEDPLFEQANVDELLGIAAVDGALELEDERSTKVKPVTGMDAMSLDDGPGKIVLSSQKATLLVIAAAILMVFAFVAGYLIRSSI